MKSIKIDVKIFLLAILFIMFNIKVVALSTTTMDTLCMAKTKTSLNNGTASKQTVFAYKRLLEKADKFLVLKNPSVTDKLMTPPSGNKHDYMSLSRYWWPNPDTPDKLPWIRKDGETNPDTQTDAVDRQRFGLMSEAVWNLSLAYYFTDNVKYAEKAVSMIETWFFNEETYMNPNLNYAQGVPGRTPGKASGVLDGRLVPMYIPDSIDLLKKSGLWTSNHQGKFSKWMEEYLHWLINSDLGQAESVQPNNHGTWYKYQIVSIATYLNKVTLAKRFLDITLKSLDDQFTSEGAQTHELARTRSFFYSCYNLQALFKIAAIADKLGINIREQVTANNRSISLAISYLTPVIQGEIWQHPSLKGADITLLAPHLFNMIAYNGSDEYRPSLQIAIEALMEKGFESRSDAKILEEMWLLNCADKILENE